MAMVVANVNADDNDLNIDVASIADADVNVLDTALDVDVDQLTEDAGTESGTDAVEACFRRMGYSCGGWGYRNHCWNSCYRGWNCCQPYYNYTSYYCYRPLYTCSYVATPVYNYYWGCH